MRALQCSVDPLFTVVQYSMVVKDMLVHHYYIWTFYGGAQTGELLCHTVQDFTLYNTTLNKTVLHYSTTLFEATIL